MICDNILVSFVYFFILYTLIFHCISSQLHLTHTDALFVSTKEGKNVDELRYSIEYLMGSLREMLIERGFIIREEVIDEMKTNLL